MKVVFDPSKDAANSQNHGISLDRAKDFDYESAMYAVDDREDYGEVRYRALGFLDALLHMLVFAEVRAGVIRAISLRKANKSERKQYAEG